MKLLEQDLRELGRVRAPEGFVDRVLVAAGLRELAPDAYAELATPIGRLFVAWNRDGISSVRRAERGAFEPWFQERFGRPAERRAEAPAWLARQVQDEVMGRPRSRLRFDLRGLSEFERAVLGKTAEIPRGEVRPYAWVAREIRRPRAVRAVGTVLANNPVPILVPCHRVVRSDGAVGEYGMGGPELKRKMLALEGLDPSWLEALTRRGTRFLGSRTTHIFCLPSCRHARRVKAANLVEFRSDREAVLSGYRPCQRCRPAAS